jgi:squalene synthase HpnC
MSRQAADIEQAYAECEALTRRHYENFSIASFLLPWEVRRHLYALYGFARGVDDLGDEVGGDRLARLDEWEGWLGSIYGEGPTTPGPLPPVFIALAETVADRGLPREPFQRLIEANRRDQRVKRYETYEDLLTYCTYSADPVGRLVLVVFGRPDPGLWPMSDATCTALQLTNFWQDVTRDLALDRIYIPTEEMDRFGVSEEELGRAPATPAFRRMMRVLVARARVLFERGRPLSDHLQGRLRVDLRLFTRGGEAVLEAIEQLDHDVLTRRPTLSAGRRSGLLLGELTRWLVTGGR